MIVEGEVQNPYLGRGVEVSDSQAAIAFHLFIIKSFNPHSSNFSGAILSFATTAWDQLPGLYSKSMHAVMAMISNMATSDLTPYCIYHRARGPPHWLVMASPPVALPSPPCCVRQLSFRTLPLDDGQLSHWPRRRQALSRPHCSHLLLLPHRQPLLTFFFFFFAQIHLPDAGGGAPGGLPRFRFRFGCG